MPVIKSKTPGLVIAFAVFAGMAQAEARWDGLLNDGANVNWFALQQEKRDKNSLEQRGIETNFNEAPMFEREFQVETLREKVSKPFSGFNRDR